MVFFNVLINHPWIAIDRLPTERAYQMLADFAPPVSCEGGRREQLREKRRKEDHYYF
jgi:hypothetical protein